MRTRTSRETIALEIKEVAKFDHVQRSARSEIHEISEGPPKGWRNGVQRAHGVRVAVFLPRCIAERFSFRRETFSCWPGSCETMGKCDIPLATSIDQSVYRRSRQRVVSARWGGPRICRQPTGRTR